MTRNDIDTAVKAIIGPWSEWTDAEHPLESSELRRFHQATIDPARRYWDQAYAERSLRPILHGRRPAHHMRRLQRCLADRPDLEADLDVLVVRGLFPSADDLRIERKDGIVA